MNRRVLALEGLSVLAAGIFLGFLGPFSSYELAPLARYGYWIGLTCVAYLLIRPLLSAGRRLARWAELPEWAGELLASLFAAFLISALVALLLSDMRVVEALGRPDLPLIFLQVWAIGLLIYLGIRQVLRVAFFGKQNGASAAMPAPDADVPPSLQPAFLKGLPIRSLDDLICLRMEDHYVRAYFAGGSQLFLMRLRDAVAQLGEVDGALVSRSWWVQKRAVKRIYGPSRSRRIELVNGLIVPVARSRLADLKATGWT